MPTISNFLSAVGSSQGSNRAAKFLSFLGLSIVLLIVALVACNQYGAFRALDTHYRISTSTLCLVFAFTTACLSPRLAIIGCMFALPLLPTLARQIQLYLGYGRVFGEHAAGFDLIAGLVLGLIVHAAFYKRPVRSDLVVPWQAGLVIAVLTASTVVAISRNLHQTGSVFSGQVLLYNLLHLRSLGWHDDYRPLLDWVAYGCVFAFMAAIIPALKNISNRNDIIFIPLITSLMIATVVGWQQSATGIGLSLDQRNFRVDQFGFMALGFQPDLHAFGGQLLIAAVGLFGYLYWKKNPSFRLVIFVVVIPLSWIVLLLSKSKTSFISGVLCLVLIALIWLFRKSTFLPKALIGLSLFYVLTLLSALVFPDLWARGILSLIQGLGIPDFDALNYKLSYRIEVYRAALHMFSLFPFLGLGLGEFYRQSANADLTQSFFLSIQQNGENAHNYFLQTLVENGALGFAAFVILLGYPLWRSKQKRQLIPASIALIAIFAGNLFSHSMLVRENLFIAASFVALLYACLYSELETEQTGQIEATFLNRQGFFSVGFSVLRERLSGAYLNALGMGAAILIIALCGKEVYQSMRSEVFQTDLQCSKFRQLDPDGWTSGLYVVAMPKGTQGVRIQLLSTQPNVEIRPLLGTLTMVDHNYQTVLQKDLYFSTNKPQELELLLPAGVVSDRDYRVELKIDRCFIPRNLGMNGDGRRLGVRIDALDWVRATTQN